METKLGVKMGTAMLLLLLLLPSHWIVLAAAAGGPCSVNQVEIEVNLRRDLAKRFNYSANQTVRLVVVRDILIDTSLVFDDLYACTILTSDQDLQHNILTTDDSFPALHIRSTSNILIHNISFQFQNRNPDLPTKCSLPDGTGRVCPLIYVHKSYGVQIVQTANLNGRIDVWRSANVSIDNVSLSTVSTDCAGITVQMVGSGPNLTGADVSITNNVITGGVNGVLLYQRAVGVIVANNLFVNQVFSGVQCGLGVHNVGDCMMTNIANNIVTTVDGFIPGPDAAGFYFDTHWVNPGNYLTCNYVANYTQCLYLDYASSGVVVDGMVCYNTRAGLKLNAGHSNNVSSFLNIQVMLPAWISCQNYDVNNCLNDPGSSWDSQRLQLYNSEYFQELYPYLNDFCNLTSINGTECNPDDGYTVPANVTGACSGIPTGNIIEVVVVDAQNQRYIPFYKKCDTVLDPVVSLNSFTFNNPSFNHTNSSFIDFDNGDFGIHHNSTIYDDFPDFHSCPKHKIGPQVVKFSSYSSRFNIPYNL